MKTIVLNFFIYFHFFVCSVAFLSFSSRIRHCSIDFFFICCTHCFNFSRLSALRRLRKTFTWSDRIDIFLFFTTKSPSTGGTAACVCVCVCGVCRYERSPDPIAVISQSDGAQREAETGAKRCYWFLLDTHVQANIQKQQFFIFFFPQSAASIFCEAYFSSFTWFFKTFFFYLKF